MSSTGPGAERSAHRSRPSWRLHVTSIVVLVVGLLATAALATTTEVIYDKNEDRLLQLRVRDAGALLAEALPGVETPLASATELAQATRDPSRFDNFMRPYIAPAAGVVSASLWSLSGGSPKRLALVGASPFLSPSTPGAPAFFKAAVAQPLVQLTLRTEGTSVRLGFAYSPANSHYVAYEERALQANRQARVASNSAFANLIYAIYLGPGEHPSDLVSTDTSHLPISGRRAEVVIPFGGSAFTLVMTPDAPLAGTFFERLPWIVGLLGVLVTAEAAYLVERLVRRREYAEAIAAERDRTADDNRRLYEEQRSIAGTLQRALLPHELPRLPGAEVEARYRPGVAGIEVGGDWYDVIKVDEDRIVFVVGDVSGRGLRAATIMAELRYAIRAYVADGDVPETILEKLSHLHSFETDGHFATVLCAALDLGTQHLRVASAGHLRPIVASGGSCFIVPVTPGVPIGVHTTRPYEAYGTDLAAEGTLLAFTDGLVERRGQLIDVATEQVRGMVSEATGSLGELLDEVLATVGAAGLDDDTAILGIRWTR